MELSNEAVGFYVDTQWAPSYMELCPRRLE